MRIRRVVPRGRRFEAHACGRTCPPAGPTSVGIFDVVCGWTLHRQPRFAIAMVAGFLGVPLFKFVVPRISEWGQTIALAEELAPSFMLALLAGVAATLFTRTTINP